MNSVFGWMVQHLPVSTATMLAVYGVGIQEIVWRDRAVSFPNNRLDPMLFRPDCAVAPVRDDAGGYAEPLRKLVLRGSRLLEPFAEFHGSNHLPDLNIQCK